MAISFNEISTTIRTPGSYVEFDNSKANKGLVLDASRSLLLAQKLTTGSATLNLPVRVTSTAQAVGLFGRGSMAAQMVEFFKNANSQSDLWVLPLSDNSSGVAATAFLQITGTATQAGTLSVYLGGRVAQVAVALGATAATVATNLATVVNADLDMIVTAVAATTGVTFTCRHKGEVFNGFDIRVNYYLNDYTPTGLTTALFTTSAATVSCTSLSGGTANPDLATPLAALGDEQYHYVANPYVDAANLSKLEVEFSSRWSGNRQIEGQIWSAAAGTHATLVTLGTSRNSEVNSILGAYKSPSPPWLWASVYTAIAAAYLDIDPARPLQTLRLTGLLAPVKSDRFSRTERNILLWNGIATFLPNVDGTCSLERAVTTYRLNSLSLTDPSYLDVETLATLAALRRTYRTWMAQKFPRHKLADDGTNFGPGQAIVTPSIIACETLAIARKWEERGWVENISQFKKDLIVERNSTDPCRVDTVIPPDVVNQLRVLAGQIQFRV